MFHALKMPLLLLAIVVSGLLGHDLLTTDIKAGLYSISLSIKEVLLFLLPVLIFSFLFNSIMMLKSHAFRVLLVLIPLIMLSNLCTAWISYGAGLSAQSFFSGLCAVNVTIDPLTPLWSFKLTPLLSNDRAFILAAFVGFLMLMLQPERGALVGKKIVETVLFCLNRIFVPLIPIFIAGFVVKLAHDQILAPLFKTYCYVILGIVGVAYGYLFILYMTLARHTGQAFQLMLSPMLIGFCTMSSAAALPSMLMSTEKMTGRPDLTRAIVPPITNFHLIGDCIAIPLLAFGIMSSFGLPFPDMMTYALFACYFVLAKFAVAAVPGGGILVMLPILQSQLGLNGEMLSLITTLYVMFDCLITPANIMGNGAFSMFYTRIYRRFFESAERMA